MPAGAPSPPAGEGGAPSAGFDRGLFTLIIAQVGLHACMTGVRLAAPLMALQLGYSALSVGLLMGLFALAPTALAMRAGRLADRHGYHLPMRRAVGMSAAGAAIALAASHAGGAAYGVLCLAAVLTGAGANFGLIVLQTSAGRRARDTVDRRRVFSWLGLAPSVANAVGPVIAGTLIDSAGFATAYGVLLALPFAALIAVRRVPAESRPWRAAEASGPPGVRGAGEPPAQMSPPAGAAGARVPAPQASTWSLLRLPGMGRLLLVNWALSASWDLHAFLLPILGHERGFSATAIGSVLGVFAATVAAVRLLLPFIASRLREERVLPGAMLWAGAVFVAYPFAGSVVAMACCAAGLGLALGMVQPMIMSALHHLAPPQRQGEAIALRSMTLNLSSALMPLGFGLLGGAVGAVTLFWLMGAVLGAGSWPARRVVAG